MSSGHLGSQGRGEDEVAAGRASLEQRTSRIREPIGAQLRLSTEPASLLLTASCHRDAPSPPPDTVVARDAPYSLGVHLLETRRSRRDITSFGRILSINAS